MNEEWKPIKGYEGLYEISNCGRVKGIDRKTRVIRKGHSQEMRVPEKIFTGYKGKTHYCQVALYKDGIKKHMQVHRLVAEAFIPNPDNKRQVNHIDGNKQNNIVTNLEWVTPSENILHSFKTGLNPCSGEKNFQAKLTKEQVTEIKRVYKKGDKKYGSRPLARLYGVKHSSIYAITHGLTWREVN